MSIFCKFDVGPTGRRFRRAVDSDKYNIEQFWKKEHTEQLFGDVDIGHLIELAVLAICLIDKKKDVTGFLAFFDYPNIPWVDPAEWEYWMRNMFLKYYLSRNTLFLHFMECIDEVAPYFLEEALVSVFMNDSYLNYIILLVPPDCPPDVVARYKHFTNVLFNKFLPRKEVDDTHAHKLYMYVASRKDFCPKLKIRRAVEEDNDEIVNILDKKSPILKELYGDYYISELIKILADTGRDIIVAEDKNERAVGVMCLNTNINYQMLQDTYDLQPFHGLIKMTPLEKEISRRRNNLLETFGDPIRTGQFGPFHELKNIDIHQEKLLKAETAKSSKRKESKGNAKVKFSVTENIMNFSNIIGAHQPSFGGSYDTNLNKDFVSIDTSRQSSINTLPLEGDAFEYEIVNIDQNAIKFITESLSYDVLSRRSDFFSPKASLDEEEPLPLPVGKFRRKSSTKPFLKTMSMPDTSSHIAGDSNAFSIELFGLRDDIDERRAYDLLEVAFEIMANREYCIIQVPSSEKNFALLQHFCFVPMKNNVCCKYSLYVAHRNAVLGKLRVRRAEFADIPQIAILLNNLQGRETIWTVENSIKRKKHHAFVLQSGIHIIGLAIMEPSEQIDFIRIRFNLNPLHIDKYHYKGDCHPAGFTTVKSIIIYPVFEQHFRFFARDIMRLSSSTCLLWLTAYRNKWVGYKANSLAFVMAPVLPRKSRIDCHCTPELERFAFLSKEIMAFSSWYLSKKITSIPRMNVDTRIVIVGSSRTTFGFLKELIFSDASSYLTFTNVTLVSPRGLPFARQSRTSSAHLMFLQYNNNYDKYLKSVPYTYYVNVIQGRMVDIDRKNKFITLNNDSRYHYDMLFLLMGKQYQHPSYMKGIFDKDLAVRQGNAPSYERVDIPRSSDTPLQLSNHGLPNNVFLVNDLPGALNAMNFIKFLISTNKDHNILVYGNTIETYCCITALIEAGVKPENIIFIEPFPPENPNKPRVPVFCNHFVDTYVRSVINDLKIQVYTSYYFDSWFVNITNTAAFVSFVSKFQMITLECGAFFYYGRRGLDINAFIAINKNGLVYNGGVVVDHEFRTKDPSVYAAGSATSYSRQYYADNKRQKYYDSYEVGEKLGLQIRTELDPLFPKVSKKKRVSFDSTSSSHEEMPLLNKLLTFVKPVVICCVLPGNLHYLDVRSPGKKIPNHYIQTMNLNGQVLETFEEGYFKLHLNSDLVVDGITCLTNKKYHLENFTNLYGQPTVVLNNVLYRFKSHQIKNFYKFFTSPWALYLYHDLKDELFASVKQLVPKNSDKNETLEDLFRNIASQLGDNYHHTSWKKEIMKRSQKSPYVEGIMEYVFEWLSECDLLLPMYLHPSQKIYYKFNKYEYSCLKKKKWSLRKILYSLKAT